MRIKELIHELKHHLPLTSVATILAIAIVIIFNQTSFDLSEKIFEGFHFAHIFLASVVASAMFYRYKSKLFFSLFVGVLSSVIFGSVSDVIFPYLGAFVFNLKPEFHLPLIEEPILILGIGIFGGLSGIFLRITKLPHFLHVGISVLASMFYLVIYTSQINLFFILLSFILVVVSVVLPCCIGDIVLPFLFLGEKIKNCDCHEK